MKVFQNMAWLSRSFLRLFAASTLALSLAYPAIAAEEAHGADTHEAAEHEGGHAEGHHAEGHGAAHGAHHEFNWYYGFLGENAEIEHPTVLWRTPGMPVPFLAYIFNAAILFWVLVKYGKAPILDGLKARRQRIVQGMDQAAKMKAEAEEQLSHYQAKLDDIETEVTRIRKEIREAAEAEREHLLAEAHKRRERMQREAEVLVQQELKAAHEILVHDTVKAAVARATELVSSKLNSGDHQRVSEEYLQSLDASLQSVQGGRL